MIELIQKYWKGVAAAISASAVTVGILAGFDSTEYLIAVVWAGVAGVVVVRNKS